MDYKYRFEELKEQADALALDATAMLDKYNAACEFTSKFLATCSKHYIREVCIGVSNKIVPSSVAWPFNTSNSIFAMGNSENGWPKIWEIVEKMGIGGGCGNSDQHQSDNSNLVDGAYQHKDGKWIKID
jgi:hypothetical protein